MSGSSKGSLIRLAKSSAGPASAPSVFVTGRSEEQTNNDAQQTAGSKNDAGFMIDPGASMKPVRLPILPAGPKVNVLLPFPKKRIAFKSLSKATTNNTYSSQPAASQSWGMSQPPPAAP